MSQNPLADDRAEPVLSIDEIRERAYDLWDRNHRPDGYELEFWLMAERELTAERRARLKQEAGSASGDASSPATMNFAAAEATTL